MNTPASHEERALHFFRRARIRVPYEDDDLRTKVFVLCCETSRMPDMTLDEYFKDLDPKATGTAASATLRAEGQKKIDSFMRRLLDAKPDDPMLTRFNILCDIQKPGGNDLWYLYCKYRAAYSGEVGPTPSGRPREASA